METCSSINSDINTEHALHLDRNYSYMISIGLSRIRGRPEGHQGTLIIRGVFLDFPGGSDGKASACNVGDPGLIPGQEDPLEKEMATHSSVLAWRIPWMEEPG